MFTLRPHQIHDLQRLREALREHRCVLLVAPCGYGKGVITTYIIENAVLRGKHVLFLVHGRDRVNDMDERVTKLGIAHGVIMGSRRQDLSRHVQVSSVDTVYRMAEKPPADLIIIDECHLAMSPTFRKVLACYPEASIIGQTATPMLGNGFGLGDKCGGIFEAMVTGPTVKDLIGEGYLVGSHVICTPQPPGMKGLRKKKTGDYDEKEGEAIADDAKVIGDIISHWKRHSSDRKTVSFGFTQAHAFHIAERFREAGVNWGYIDADTKDGDIHTPGTRRFLHHQYDNGDLVGLSSVGCISIGWDHPVCKSLILASKTASFPLYHQRLGRGSRPYGDYKEFRVHDHCGNFWEHAHKGPFFESDISWQLNTPVPLARAADQDAVRSCDTETRVPEAGIPSSFKGECSADGVWMLPCFFTFIREPGMNRCPACGMPFEVAVRCADDPDYEESEGELLEPDVTKDGHVFEPKIRFLSLVKTGAVRGYKPGWAAMQFKAEYLCWPERAWNKEAERERLVFECTRERSRWGTDD